MNPPSSLTDEQLDSLLDVLVHRELFDEVGRLRDREALKNFGIPLQSSDKDISPAFPILRIILETLIVPLPGYKNLPPEFWSENVYGILDKLGEFQLSKSYDVGSISARTTISAILSAILEYPAYLILRGAPSVKLTERSDYDLNSASDLEEAWKVFLHKALHEDEITTVFNKIAETDNLELQPNLVQAAHRYMVLNLGSFIHYLSFVPPSSSHIVNSVLKAYGQVKPLLSTLIWSIGFLPGAVMDIARRVILYESRPWRSSKPGSSDVPESNTPLQKVMSRFLAWDLPDTETTLKGIKSELGKVNPDVWIAIDNFVSMPKIREDCRNLSRKRNDALVNGVMDLHGLKLIEPDRVQKFSEYLALKLAIHNRISLLKTFCNSQDRSFLDSVNALAVSFVKIVQAVHTKCSLSRPLSSCIALMDSYKKLAANSLSAKSSSLPAIHEFVAILADRQQELHTFLHLVMKPPKQSTPPIGEMNQDSPEPKISLIGEMYQDYARTVVSSIGETHEVERSAYSGLSIVVASDLETIYSDLSESKKRALIEALDEHTAYRKAAAAAAQAELQKTIDGKMATHHRSGCFGRATDLIDSIPLPPRPKAQTNGLATPEEDPNDFRGSKTAHSDMITGKCPPKSDTINDLVGPKFRDLLSLRVKEFSAQARGMDWE